MPEVQEFLKKQWGKFEAERKTKERAENRRIAEDRLAKKIYRQHQITGGILGGLGYIILVVIILVVIMTAITDSSFTINKFVFDYNNTLAKILDE